MARDPNVARLPQNPKISVGLTWEKEKEGERGRLVFSDLKYEPITIEVDELKGTHQPLIRIIYYRGGNDYARYVRPKSGAPLNAQSIMAGIEVTPDRMRSVQRMIGLKKIFFYKTVLSLRTARSTVTLSSRGSGHLQTKLRVGRSKSMKNTVLGTMKRQCVTISLRR